MQPTVRGNQPKNNLLNVAAFAILPSSFPGKKPSCGPGSRRARRERHPSMFQELCCAGVRNLKMMLSEKNKQ
jgi:hypothetical protein